MKRSGKKPRPPATVIAPSDVGAVGDDSPAPPTALPSEPAPARRGGWRARALTALKLASGVGLVVVVAAAVAWGAHRYALTSPRFAIADVQVDGAQRASAAALAEAAGARVGQNVFALDTAAAEARLLADPWVSAARVSRRLPDGVRIEVTERQAAALAAIGERLYVVTPTGEPFKELADGDPADLPVVTGMDAESLARDRARALERIGVALEVLRHWERIPMSRVHPAQEVILHPGGQVSLVVGKAAAALHLGHGPWRKKLLMAESVLRDLGAKGRVPGIVFLDNEAHPERVVVRMR
ncbi:MAG: FtsQ-type POTRA domain-containing protein [Polyangiaceae bacterium]|nr:FtsQ-type POTRA domain-containing protein [Polyangiaceae bacterium]